MNTLNIHTKIFLSDPSETRFTIDGSNRTAASAPSPLAGVRRPPESCHCSPIPEPILVYVVDDLPCLVELYAAVLAADGHRVRTFGDRNAAFAALKTESEKPALLITDHRNSSMPTDEFLRNCRAVHPSLRILMATGFDHYEARSAAEMPDGFLKKPFTFDELRDEVHAVVAPEQSRSV